MLFLNYAFLMLQKADYAKRNASIMGLSLLLCDPGSELRLGEGERKRRANVIPGKWDGKKQNKTKTCTVRST